MPERILIVEDERITAEHLHDVLVDFGYEVTGLASSGAEAIANAEKEHPDLALMDIRIKGELDGTETARILRERFDIPVVYLTAHADRETLGRAKEAGPLGYLVKPFQEAELQAGIEIALHKHRTDRQSRSRNELLTSALESLGQGIIWVDRGGAVTLLNAAAEAWTGWSQQDAIGKSVDRVFALIDGDTAQPVTAPPSEVLRGMKSGIHELAAGVLLVPRTRGGRSVAGTIAPIVDLDGSTAGAVIVFGAATSPPQTSQPVPNSSWEEDSVAFGRFRLVAASPAMKQLIRFSRRVAESEASTVLLEGESGTGKDVMAQFMHHFGKRKAGPFIALNCAAIPETLLESELFGYEKGAFTDARSQKRGLFEVATGGTIFLDEIGEMPLLVQAKMLRVLEDQVFRRLGGVQDIQVELRIVAATNRKLTDIVKSGAFRLDLYYRLNVIQVTIPALRDRKEDVLPLAQYFVGVYNQKYSGRIRGLSESALKHLHQYDWPGNVRELRNTIERAVLLEETQWIEASSLRMRSTEMEQEALPGQNVAPTQAASPDMNLKQVQLGMIQEALKRADGNQTKAAAILGISRDTLRYRMKKLNLKCD
ncbi:MAG: sigma 54-interacting transcriptional regulator [Bryobacteraceae bacterium]